MSQPTTGILFNSTNPPAPDGNQNTVPQSDNAIPQQSVTSYPQKATAGLLGVVRPDGTTINVGPDGTISTETGGATSIIAAVQQQWYVFGVDTGTANAYVVAQTPPPNIVVGSKVVFKALNANTGPSTLTIDTSPVSTSAPITKEGTEPLTGGEIDANQIIETVFDGINFQIVGGGSDSIGTGGSGGGSGSGLGDVIPAGVIDGVNVTFTIPSDGSPGPGGSGGGGGGGGGGAGFVQSASGFVNNNATVSKAFASNNTAGNCLVVDAIMAAFSHIELGTIAVSDSQGNAYTLVNQSVDQNGWYVASWIAPNCLAGANTVTITYSGFLGVGTGIGVAIHEYSAIATTASLDTFAYAATAAIPAASLGASITTSVGPDLLHVFAALGGLGTTVTLPFSESLGAAARESQSNVGSGTGSFCFASYDISEGAAGTFSETVNFVNPIYEFLYVIALKSTSASGGGGGGGGTSGEGARGNLYLNGVLQDPLKSPPDYTLVGTTITMRNPPVASPSPDSLLWVYLSGSVGPPGPAGGGISALVGDVTAGPGEGTQTATLAASGVTAGTYPKVTVDAKGRVTSGASLSAGDIPNIAESQVTNLPTDLASKVSSVALTVPSRQSVTGSPINGGSGTLAISDNVQPENTVFAGPIGPASPAAVPTFRALVLADLPLPIEKEVIITGDGSTKVFTLPDTPSPSLSLSVFINGVRQHTPYMTVSGPTLTWTVAPRSTDDVRARYTH